MFYELLSLHTQMPTLTTLAWRYRKTWVGKGTLAMVMAVLTYHLCLQTPLIVVIESPS